MVTTAPYIIMPVKDSIDLAEKAIRAIASAGYPLTVYDDYSTIATAQRLDALARELHIGVVHIAEHLDHPSPNYRWVLQQARKHAIEHNQHLVIIESDVFIRKETLPLMLTQVKEGVGMVAAVTVDEEGKVNFPYTYAAKWEKQDTVETTKRFSFCCTLLTHALLQALDFDLLDPTKNWYDVTISHQSIQHGFRNLLMLNNPVVHKPHSSRPWKQLKYTHPLLYYWRKLTQKRDRI